MRHTALATLWLLCLAVTFLSLAAPILFIVPFTPVLAIITADAVGNRGTAERQHTAWRVIYTAVMALLVAASLVGIGVLVVAPLDLSILTAVPAMALVFLASLVLGIRALTVRSPRRAAIPAIVAHVPMTLVMLQSLVTPYDNRPSFGPGIAPWGAVLVLSALASILAAVSFDGQPAEVVPTAKVRG